MRPAPAKVKPPPGPRSASPDGDGDGVPGIEEDQAPGITGPDGAGPLAGDGNGDGIEDSLQSAVASKDGMTLVTSSKDGKPASAGSSALLASMEQKAAPKDAPKGLEMPMGLASFETQLAQAGSSESFSLYVDPKPGVEGGKGVNGYWVKDGTGTWVNLASEPYGGRAVTEGDRLRLDFRLTDGGPFDADGQADGVITIPEAAAGRAPLSIVGQAPDLAPLGFWF